MPLKALHALSESESVELKDACDEDMESIETLLWQGVRSASALPQELPRRLIESGGKRIRPYLLCLTYHSFRQTAGALQPRASRQDLHTLAAVAEWVHTATLFHDDVLDESPMRRDKPAAHILHGNKVSILVGDFVYAEAFALLMERGHLEPSRELAATIKAVVEGELLQHRVATDRSTSFEDYNQIALAKTGRLFGWCTGTGCWAAGSELHALAAEFGSKLGQAFQMADDLFDTFSIQPRNADAETLTEWIDSSAPLPVVLAAEHDPTVESLWRDLALAPTIDARRALAGEVLQSCSSQLVVGDAVRRLEDILRSAEALRMRLGDSASLKSALELIESRARQGTEFAVAHSKGVEKAQA